MDKNTAKAESPWINSIGTTVPKSFMLVYISAAAHPDITAPIYRLKSCASVGRYLRLLQEYWHSPTLERKKLSEMGR